MTSRYGLLSITAAAALLAAPVLAQNTSTPRDGTPGNPPSTATQRAADAVTGSQTPADGTPGNPPGTAVGRAVDRALGTNMSGANPQNSDGTANNPPGTAAGRAVDRATSGTSTGTSGTSSATPPSPPASTAAPTAPTTGSVAQPSTLGTSPSLREGTANTTPGTAATPNARPMSGTASPDAERASKIIGASVYNDRNESVGSVDDLLFRRGQSPLAVVSVGGFLGIGAKLVTVPFEELRWNEGESRWQVMGVTRESLTSLPAFSYADARRG